MAQAARTDPRFQCKCVQDFKFQNVWCCSYHFDNPKLQIYTEGIYLLLHIVLVVQ